MDEELKKFLEKQTCRGCYNHCQLSNPNCGRSKIFIQEATEKFNKQYKDFKDFQKEFFEKIDIGLKDVKNGNFQSFETFCREMEEKYDIK